MHCKCGHHVSIHRNDMPRYGCMVCECDKYEAGKQIQIGSSVLVPNGEKDSLFGNVEFIYETTLKALVRFDSCSLPRMVVPIPALALIE